MILCISVDIGLKFHSVPLGHGHILINIKVLKFVLKSFTSQYVLNMKMDEVYTLHVGRYWSEVICCAITTHLGDFEIKVTYMYLEILSYCFKI